MRTEEIELRPFGPVMPARYFIVDVKEYVDSYTELEKLGCTVEKIGNLQLKVIYPLHTTRQELYPRTMCERYQVLLPGGIELQEKVWRGKIHYLYFMAKDEEQSQEGK